ncbi:MAG TPA: DUF6183 family protein [Acidimicrobiia bacterium]|nr:DUF6183 family protein [Acidimicrobiia bacterium]
MISRRAIEAIEVSDVDDLLRVVDGLCKNSHWDELVELKQRCGEAVGRGKQLWGVEEHIRYRLALEAPGPWAGAALNEGVARFALGPLPEVAASTKTWAQLEPYLDDGPWRAVTAAERVVRGEVAGPIADLPDQLMDWEPSYQLATYKSDKVETPSPAPVEVSAVSLPDVRPETIDDPQSEGALFDLIQPWVTESNGRYEVATVEGDSPAAIRALGLSRARLGEMAPQLALSWMGWAGASGGAHGRRRGAAAGRYGAWWTVATLSDLDWPPDPEEIGDAAGRLDYHWFDDGSPGTGWELRMAISDRTSGLAWAIAATDSV